MKRVELYGRVRHAVMIEGLSQREAARCFGIDPRTVRKMLSYSVPPGYVRTRPPVRPKLDPFIGIIDRILEEDKDRPKKQRHTSKRIFERLIPSGKPGGGKRRVAIREVINGVMYILSTGCQWRALPKDLPPRSTVHDYLGLWNWDGTLDRIHHALYLKCREKAAREASPTACIIDSQSVKSAEKGGLASTATASMPAS